MKLYVRFPPWVGDVDVGRGSIRSRWNRFGPIFAAAIRRRRGGPRRALAARRRGLDQVFVDFDEVRRYLR